MSNFFFWLSEAQVARLRPFFPRSHGKPRVDDRRVLSGIIFFNRSGLRWCDAPKEYGPAKTLYNRWKRWSDNGVFARIMMGLAAGECREQDDLNQCDLPESASHGVQPACEKRMARPVCKRQFCDGMISLHKRIRHVGTKAAAKMEIRASRSS